MSSRLRFASSRFGFGCVKIFFPGVPSSSRSLSTSTNSAFAPRKYVRLTPSLVSEAAECIADTFGSGEVIEDPLSWLFHLRRNNWLAMTLPFIERAANASLSVVALNELTGRVDGVMVNEDWITPRPTAYRDRLSPEWWPIRSAFSELHQRFVDARLNPIERGEMIRCMYFSCVHTRARGQGVMRGLWRQSVDAAREHGFRHITAQASTETVRSVLHEQLGFKEVTSIRYSTWEYDHELQNHQKSLVLGELSKKNPTEWNRLSISMRTVPSNLYV